jgi:gliding motility associated protien GldN
MKKFAIIAAIALLFSGAGLKSFAQILDNPPSDVVYYDNNDDRNVKPLAFQPVRKADIMWSKRIWREIDFRQKMNQPFYYPIVPHNNWRSFMTILMDALKEGSITAYDISQTDEFLVPLTYQEIVTRQIDTMHRVLTRSYPPYDEYDTTIYSEFDPSKVMRLRIKEDWYFDKKRSQMEVRIQGICPVMIKERDGQEFREPLFWIYFPEARPVLAQALVFNRFNSAARLTYDELFEKRIFSSYIYKEQNVYDRRIAEYASGLDALLESERIKDELLNFEESLWEY